MTILSGSAASCPSLFSKVAVNFVNWRSRRQWRYTRSSITYYYNTGWLAAGLPHPPPLAALALLLSHSIHAHNRSPVIHIYKWYNSSNSSDDRGRLLSPCVLVLRVSIIFGSTVYVCLGCSDCTILFLNFEASTNLLLKNCWWRHASRSQTKVNFDDDHDHSSPWSPHYCLWKMIMMMMVSAHHHHCPTANPTNRRDDISIFYWR